MIFIYNLLIIITGFFIKAIALFNKKLALFVKGRKDVFRILEKNINPKEPLIWFHAASLGEFEQGLPVIENVKKEYPSHKVLVTFFSSSGYEVKKEHPIADLITYLPLDTLKNTRKFLDNVNPVLAVFIKYEFWPNYLNQLKKRNISTIVISAIFREKQLFFKSYGGFMRSFLKTFDHFFVQDEHSKKLLKKIDYQNVSVSGDTRFDRVFEILKQDNNLSFINEFKNNKTCLIAGSTWKEDEVLLVNFINNTSSGFKYIIAPHNIKATQIQNLKNSLSKNVVLYSEMEGENLSDFDVFILDTIGILTKVYSYADIAYVGGGMGNSGLHNTLEPAVFGVPILIGKNYTNFKEARDLVSLGGIISVKDAVSFNTTLLKLIEDENYRKTTGIITKNYVNNNIGASKKIGEYISSTLSS